jgi:opacity protein-like surface antigen
MNDAATVEASYRDSYGIAVMAKASSPGRTETRLVPLLTFDEAAALNTAFLKDVAANVLAASKYERSPATSAYSPPGLEAVAFFREALPPEMGLLEAGYPNFGTCLSSAIEQMLDRGNGSAVVLNSDSPTLPTALLVEAVTLLARPGDHSRTGLASGRVNPVSWGYAGPQREPLWPRCNTQSWSSLLGCAPKPIHRKSGLRLAHQRVAMQLRVLGAIVLAALTAAPAMAADVPMPAPVYYPPPVVVVPGWAGLYFGATVGGHSSRDDITTTTSAANYGAGGAATVDALSPVSITAKGAIAGVQAGYNFQFGRFVAGIEADVSWLAGTNTRTIGLPGLARATVVPAALSNSPQGSVLVTLRPRLGVTFDALLAYVTGGLAFASVKTSDSVVVNALETTNDLTSHTGWAFGGGLEYTLPKGWLLKAEYLYVSIGIFDTTIGCVSGNGFTCVTAADVVVHHKYTDNIFRVGVSHIFAGPL